MSFTAPWLTVEVGYGSTWQTEPASITWTDETASILLRDRIKTTRGASSARGKVDVGTAAWSFINADRRFDPTHASGALFGNLLPGTPVRILAWPVDQLVTVDGQPITVDNLPVTTGDPIAVWRGTVPAWPQRYDISNRHAWVPVGAYDGFDKLSRAKIPRSVIEKEILADSPVAYWPLDEASGTVMLDRSGNGLNGTYVAGTAALNEEKGLTDDVRVPGLQLDGEHAGVVRDMAAAVLARPLTWTAILQIDLDATDTQAQMFSIGNGNTGAGSGFRAALSAPYSSDTLVNFEIGIKGLTGGQVLGSFDPADPCHLAYRIGSAGSPQVLRDGADVGFSTSTDAGAYVNAPGVVVGGSNGAAFSDARFKGFLAHVALFDSDIGSSRISDHRDAAFTPLDGQTTDERITWILDELDWPTNLRDLSTGRTPLGPATFKPGDGALEYLRLVEATEAGLLFIAGDGSLTFHDRYWRYLETVSTVSQIIFTDDPSADERYAEFQLDLDDELLVNVARYTRRGGTEQVETDATSVATYGEAELQQTNLLLETDAQARSLAQWQVATNGSPLPRVPRVRVPLHNYSATDQATVLGLDIGHRVTIERTPQGVGSQISLDLIVEGVEIDYGFNECWVSLFVSPAPDDAAPLFLLGSSLLGGTHILAH